MATEEDKNTGHARVDLSPENLLVDLSNFCQFSVSAEAVCVCVCVCVETKVKNETTGDLFMVDNVSITSQTSL